MPADPVQRRLAAILAVHAAGYSRLMGADENGTLAALMAHRVELIEPAIAEHRGRVVKTTGDGLLAEFASVVDAVRCAVAFQDGMRVRNTDTPADRRIEFRVGVNLGDVMVRDDDVYGDGVNVAARLEALAEPGGVVVSGSVHEQVRGKLDLGFDDLRAREVKNIAEPVRVYRIGLAPPTTEGSGDQDSLFHRPAVAVLPSERPSIAVLPFDSLSPDPDQEYFADGITENLITALTRIHSFRVVGRNSALADKGKATYSRQVADELGVRYVVEGSVRRAGDRFRISA